MANLHQKKFYSSPDTDAIINEHATNQEMGYSEALREIVLDWAMLANDNVKIEGVIKDGKIIWNKASMGNVTIEEELARR